MHNTIELRKGDILNFETICKAAVNGDLALVSAIRKSDSANVALICAVGRAGATQEPSG